MLPPAGKLLVLYVAVVLLIGTVKVIACALSTFRQWNLVSDWLQHAAISSTILAFLYASYIVQLIALGNRRFSDEQLSGYILLMKEIFFHSRVLSLIGLICFGLFNAGWLIGSRRKHTPAGV
jgi:hypothetical protein